MAIAPFWCCCGNVNCTCIPCHLFAGSPLGCNYNSCSRVRFTFSFNVKYTSTAPNPALIQFLSYIEEQYNPGKTDPGAYTGTDTFSGTITSDAGYSELINGWQYTPPATLGPGDWPYPATIMRTCAYVAGIRDAWVCDTQIDYGGTNGVQPVRFVLQVAGMFCDGVDTANLPKWWLSFLNSSGFESFNVNGAFINPPTSEGGVVLPSKMWLDGDPSMSFAILTETGGSSSADPGGNSSCPNDPLCPDISTTCGGVTVTGLSGMSPVGTYLKNSVESYGATPWYAKPSDGTSTDSLTLGYERPGFWLSNYGPYNQQLNPHAPYWANNIYDTPTAKYGYTGWGENGMMLYGVQLGQSVDPATHECVHTIAVLIGPCPSSPSVMRLGNRVFVTYESRSGISGTYNLVNDPADGGNIYRTLYNGPYGAVSGRELIATVPLTLSAACGAAPVDSSNSNSTASNSHSNSNSSNSAPNSSNSNSNSNSTPATGSSTTGSGGGPGGGSTPTGSSGPAGGSSGGSTPTGGSSAPGGGSSSPTESFTCCPVIEAIFDNGCTADRQVVTYTSTRPDWSTGAPSWDGNYGHAGTSTITWAFGVGWTLKVKRTGYVNTWTAPGDRYSCPPMGNPHVWTPSPNNTACNTVLVNLVCGTDSSTAGSSNDSRPVDETGCATPIVVPSLPYDHTATVDGVGIWFKYTPTHNCGPLTVSACNITTAISADLRIYADCSGTPIVADSISCIVDTRTTRQITADVLAGHDVYVLVRAKNAGETGTIKVTFAGTGCDGSSSAGPCTTLHMPLTEGSGTTAYDTDCGHNGTITDGTWTSTCAGAALLFNGSTSKVVTAWNGPTGTGPMSVSFWIKTTSTEQQHVVYWGQESGYGTRFGVGLNIYPYAAGDNRLCFSTSSATYDWGDLPGLFDGNWHHVVLVKGDNASGTDVIAYLDGVSLGYASEAVNFGVSTIDVIAGDPVRLGAYGDDTQFFAGELKDVHIVDRVYSSGDVTTLYDAHPCLTNPLP